MHIYVSVVQSLSHVQLFVTQWTIAHQFSWPVELSRQEYWNGSHSLLQDIFLTQGSNSSPALWADSLPSDHPRNPI